MPPPPPGFAPDAAMPPPPPGFAPDAAMPPPPPGFTSSPTHSTELLVNLQAMTSLSAPSGESTGAAPYAQPAETQTEVEAEPAHPAPPITADFFARATGKGRR
jgi:hypothetical protein